MRPRREHPRERAPVRVGLLDGANRRDERALPRADEHAADLEEGGEGEPHGAVPANIDTCRGLSASQRFSTPVRK